MNLNNKKFKADIQIYKECKICLKDKPLEQFFKSKNQCKECIAERYRMNYYNHKYDRFIKRQEINRIQNTVNKLRVSQ